MKRIRTDVVVCGSGLAGLAYALKVAPEKDVVILTKQNREQANTPWAQGGIAAVSSKEDSFEAHINDTLRAGAGLCRPEVVRNVVEQAPERIKDLIEWGVLFDKDLTREGGHSARRILHFEDQTGAAIHRALLNKCQQSPRIQFLEDHFVVDLLVDRSAAKGSNPGRCFGAYVLDRLSNEVLAVEAPLTVLATGGAGKAYLYTSNWSGATGDGVAVGWRAGVPAANMEFMQFHPTCLYHPSARNFLITEALRGEGAELVNRRGEAFMKQHSPMGSLAPRDIVARGIDFEMKRSGEPCVFLEARPLGKETLQHRFPHIFQKCLELGIDISKDPIPVVPAAHYLCGGLVAKVDGETELPGLLALGETACTGLHGANRLASNSLLECLAMAHNASLRPFPSTAHEIPQAREWIYPAPTTADELVVVHHIWDEVRTLLWNYVGIVRSDRRLERARRRLQLILAEVEEYYSQYQMNSDILELRNIAIVADLTVRCALLRKESRGIHYNIDRPAANLESQGVDSVIDPPRPFGPN